jgi:hypothetical protein
MPSSSSDVQSAVAALEQFVVENDDLAELETQIGKFNIFDALRIARHEIRHSNFLAWLLDPAESHGQGALFLRAVLMDILRQSPPHLRPLSPVELDGEDLAGVEIRREWRNIDLMVLCATPAFVVAIENKVDSGEHGNQLQKYGEVLAEAFPNAKPLLMFLTTDGSEPSDERWVAYSYGDLYRVLDRCRNSNRGAIGSDVDAFLDHYLRLIGSRFMDDPNIDELCHRIYRNHRQALELIFSRAGAPSARIIGVLEDLLLRQSDRWLVVHKTSKEVHFVPKNWFELFPPIGRKKDADARAWLRCGFWTDEGECTLWVYGYPTTDPALRRRALTRLTERQDEFGFEKPKRGITDEWTFLSSDRVAKWPEDEEPNKDALLAAATEKLDAFWERMSRLPAALAPIFGEK